MKNENSNSKILPVLFGFFIMGFCDVVGITSTHVKADFGLSDTLSNMIPVALFSMFLLFSVPTGILMNRIGRKRTVLISNVITIVAMFIPLIEYNFAMSLLAFALLGIANTMLQVSLNPLLTNVVKGDRLTSSLTAGQFVKAISSFCGPYIAIYATIQLGFWQNIFPIYAIITMASTVWLMLTPIVEEPVEGKATSIKSVWTILEDRTILLLFLGILFVVGVDVGLNTASSKILMERCGMDAAEAGKMGPSIYFALRTVGAFVGAFLLARFSSVKFFQINIVVAVLALTFLVFASSQVAIIILFGVIGFTVANVFPIIYGKAIQIHPDKANEISGLMITGVFGGAVIPFFMGILSDLLGNQAGSVLIILASALYLLFCAFVIVPDKK